MLFPVIDEDETMGILFLLLHQLQFPIYNQRYAKHIFIQ